MFKNNIQFMMIAVLALLIATPVLSQSNHDFLHDKYDAMHDSPMQQKFRQIAPMPFGVVFLPWAGCTEEDMRYHFRMMKELGFTNLKQTMATPEWPEHETLRIALEEGIIPFWYGEGGWELITPELLLKLGLPENMDIKEAREHPSMLEYQKEVLYRHLEAWKKNRVEYNDKVYFHEPDAFLRPEDEEPFKNWVKQQYRSVKELSNAWNHYEVGIKEEPYKTWEDFENDNLVKTIPGSDEIVPSAGREYGQVRDILRFKADMNIKYLEAVVIPSHPEQPVRAGGEMGLFLPFASRGTDMEGIAELMKDRGSFYPSIHLAWHFEEVDYEVAPAIYMQSSIATDWFKGGWAATWESTGGPQQFSGGKGWDRKGQEGTPGYTVNTGTMTQLLLSYLAGGFKGVGLWAWNYRRAGWESGEYALLNRQNEPSERTIRAGQIAKAADKYRDEIWNAHKEPLVGVFVNWDNEAIWAAAAGPGRTHFKHYPVQARVGISRALINANIPWEYVTPSDIKAGLGPRYQIIYMPAQAAINEDLLPVFEDYVKQGGRLVIDAPGGWWTEHGKVLETGKGSAFEKIFGASIADFQYSNNVLWKIDGHVLDGFVIDIKTTSAKVVEQFQNRRPLVTENKLGKGTAVILAADASFSMKSPGNAFMESWTLKHTLNGKESPYSCPDAIVYRLTAPEADHYFFINDDEPMMTSITFTNYRYKSFTDGVTGEMVDPSAIELEAYSGRWIRCEK
jgi:beta-galactosidase